MILRNADYYNNRCRKLPKGNGIFVTEPRNKLTVTTGEGEGAKGGKKGKGLVKEQV